MTSETGKGKGLTFIEILLVVIIIGALIGISLPNLRKAFDNLQLNSASQDLQSFMNYLRQRAIVEGKIIYFNIDSENKECWAQIKDATARLKSLALPPDIGIETDQKQILFYPDGRIDSVTIKLIQPNNQNVILTTKGVYGKVKLQPSQQ